VGAQIPEAAGVPPAAVSIGDCEETCLAVPSATMNEPVALAAELRTSVTSTLTLARPIGFGGRMLVGPELGERKR